MSPGLIVAAPASGSGKTLLTLGLLAQLRAEGRRVVSAKVGPDYIDPAFHRAATGRDCLNLDTWAMRPSTLSAIVAALGAESELVVAEGVMGLFDGARVAPGRPDGSTAGLALATGWPVVLVIDVKGMAASAAALVAGFVRHAPEIEVAGVVLNRVGGERHRTAIAEALARTLPGLPVLGALPVSEALSLPSRHLGLVQACEHHALGAFLAGAARLVAEHVDVEALTRLARPTIPAEPDGYGLPPLGQRIAVARDEAFAFAYPATLDAWRRAGAELSFFSPLADEAPRPDADAIYLPGGYPELHAARLAAARGFMDGLRAAAAQGLTVFGECGGYMAMGRGLEDCEGRRHEMAGVLPVETSFAKPRLHLGYRRAQLAEDCPLGRKGQIFRGHEFHYAVAVDEGRAPLFTVTDASEIPLPAAGCRAGSAMGSFVHLIDAEMNFL